MSDNSGRVLLLALLAAIVAGVVAQYPELRRYLDIQQM
jgi:hypothetical protein